MWLTTHRARVAYAVSAGKARSEYPMLLPDPPLHQHDMRPLSGFKWRPKAADMTKAPNQTGSEPRSSGGGKGTRTPNPLLAKQVRYQLRHTPRRDSPSHRVGVFGPFGLGTLITVPPPEENSESHKCETTENPFLHDPPRKDVGLPGLEPGTSSLSAKRSNRLSYRPFAG